MKIPAALQRLIERVLAWPPVVLLLAILEVFGRAGGGILAAGLAYGALFAGMSGLLLATGIVGLLVSDPVKREELVLQITAQVPLLEPIVRDGLQSLANSAQAFSLIGLAGLFWGASQFYGGLDMAFARIFRQAKERGPIVRVLRGLVLVIIVMTAIAAGVVISSVQASLTQDLPPGAEGDAARFVSAVVYWLMTLVVVIAAVALLYRVVPNTHVPWRALAMPATLAGIVLAIMTELFALIAPRLVGGLQVFGAFAAVFAAMAWLSWSFQVLLIGAAWTRMQLPDQLAAPDPRAGQREPEGGRIESQGSGDHGPIDDAASGEASGSAAPSGDASS